MADRILLGDALNELRTLADTGISNATERASYFWARVLETAGGCWEWQGAKQNTGYGVVSIDGEMVYTHRYAYELTHPDFDKKLCVCHSCDNRRCCKPEHLFLGTHKENTDDMHRKGRAVIVVEAAHEAWRSRTHCRHGHPFTDENTYMHRDSRTGKPYRNCRICTHQRNK